MADLKPLYKRAEEAITKRNYDYARDCYLQILQVAPDEAEAAKLLQGTMQRKYKEQGAPSRITQKFSLASTSTTLAVQKNPQSRADTAQKYLLLDPENVSMRVQLATSQYDLGNMHRALAEAEMAAHANPNSAEAYKVMAKVLIALKRIPEAQGALNRAKNLKPDDRELDKLIKDQMAEATMAKGFSDEAHDYRTAIKNVDQAVELEKSGHLVKSAQDVDQYIEKWKQLHEANPNDLKVLVKMGEAHAEMKKDYRTAQEWYRKASALAPHDSQLKDRIEDMDMRVFDAAIARAQAAGDPKLKEIQGQKLAFEVKAFERRMADRPTDMQVRYQLAKRCYALGQLDRAISEFQNSVKDPKCKLDSHLYLGMSFQKKKVFDLADKNYRSAEEAAISDDKKLQIWYFWGKCYEEAKQPAKAMELYSRIAQIDFGYQNGDVAQRLERLKGSS